MKSKKSEADNTFKITTFGNLSIARGGVTLLWDTGRSRKVWNLLGYFIANKNREVPLEAIMDAMCREERITDPAGAIKNLVYRLRRMLEESDLPQYNYIVFKNGTYMWNPDIPCETDCEVFENLAYRAADPSLDEDKKIAICTQAIDLYNGRFLEKALYELWAVGYATHYHNMYIDMIHKLFEIFSLRNEYGKMPEICNKALKIDPYDEGIYRILIKSLVEMEKYKEALEAYEAIVSILWDVFGFNPTSELRRLYREIMQVTNNIETDLLTIKEDLDEEVEPEVSYFCEYGVFRDIYRFTARGINRTGQSTYIMLFTLSGVNGEDMPAIKPLSGAMARVKQLIGRFLRKGDLFTRYSVTQYMVLLPGTNYENGIMVGNRILGAYNRDIHSRNIKMQFKLQPLKPNMII